MRLLKLLPEQVMHYWPDIRACIEVAMPPYVVNNSDSMLYIQEQLLVGSIECWVAFDPGVCGVMTTQVVSDPVSACRNLLIYSLAIIGEHSEDLWQLAAEQMRRYASAKQCANIIAYSNNEHMLHIAEKLGADTSYRLITFSL